MHEPGRTAARAVTRDVDPSRLADLLERPPRATVAFVDRGAPAVLPARARCPAGAYRFGVRPDDAPDLHDRDVVLVIDDGAYWFELRGISVRGPARRVERAEPGDTDAFAWYTVEARRVLAWSYGTIREV